MGTRGDSTTPTLLSIPFSHCCEKARWALDRAGIAYREEPHMQPFARKRSLSAGGAGTLPTLVFDGALRTDSKSILKWVDERDLEAHRLFPADRALLEPIEAFTDELDGDYTVATRRVAFGLFSTDPEKLIAFVTRDVPLFEKWMVRVTAPWNFPKLAERMGLTVEQVAAASQTVDATLDRVDEQLADGRRYLFGDALTAADVTFGALTAPLVLPPEHRFLGGLDLVPPKFRERVEATRARPAGAFVLRLYAEDRPGTAAVR